MGAVLLQGGHPLAYVSKPLGPKTQGLSIYEKEYLAVLIAVEQWRTYLQLAEFIIYTDQKSLTHLNDQRLNTMWQQKVFTKLLGLSYRIVYKKGMENSAADALSRRGHPEGVCCAISLATQWCADITLGYQADPQAQELLVKLATSPAGSSPFSLQDGLIRFKQCIWVGNNQELQQKLIRAFTVHRWVVTPGYQLPPNACSRCLLGPASNDMSISLVDQFVCSCPTCQQAKVERVKYPGLLQPLETPTTAWQVISLDFVEGLPPSHGYNCVMVVVDLFSMYGHFIGLKHPFTALSVAKQFMLHVYKLHGLPTAMVSDRDRIFTSQLWRELFSLAGVELRMSSAYHPQSDGQTERVNQCMETFLRYFANAVPSKWYEFLH